MNIWQRSFFSVPWVMTAMSRFHTNTLMRDSTYSAASTATSLKISTEAEAQSAARQYCSITAIIFCMKMVGTAPTTALNRMHPRVTGSMTG